MTHLSSQWNRTYLSAGVYSGTLEGFRWVQMGLLRARSRCPYMVLFENGGFLSKISILGTWGLLMSYGQPPLCRSAMDASKDGAVDYSNLMLEMVPNNPSRAMRDVQFSEGMLTQDQQALIDTGLPLDHEDFPGPLQVLNSRIY